jgi:hypothetical protein
MEIQMNKKTKSKIIQTKDIAYQLWIAGNKDSALLYQIVINLEQIIEEVLEYDEDEYQLKY